MASFRVHGHQHRAARLRGQRCAARGVPPMVPGAKRRRVRPRRGVLRRQLCGGIPARSAPAVQSARDRLGSGAAALPERDLRPARRSVHMRRHLRGPRLHAAQRRDRACLSLEPPRLGRGRAGDRRRAFGALADRLPARRRGAGPRRRPADRDPEGRRSPHGRARRARPARRRSVGRPAAVVARASGLRIQGIEPGAERAGRAPGRGVLRPPGAALGRREPHGSVPPRAGPQPPGSGAADGTDRRVRRRRRAHDHRCLRWAGRATRLSRLFDRRARLCPDGAARGAGPRRGGRACGAAGDRPPRGAHRRGRAQPGHGPAGAGGLRRLRRRDLRPPRRHDPRCRGAPLPRRVPARMGRHPAAGPRRQRRGCGRAGLERELPLHRRGIRGLLPAPRARRLAERHRRGRPAAAERAQARRHRARRAGAARGGKPAGQPGAHTRADHLHPADETGSGRRRRHRGGEVLRAVAILRPRPLSGHASRRGQPGQRPGRARALRRGRRARRPRPRRIHLALQVRHRAGDRRPALFPQLLPVANGARAHRAALPRWGGDAGMGRARRRRDPGSGGRAERPADPSAAVARCRPSQAERHHLAHRRLLLRPRPRLPVRGDRLHPEVHAVSRPSALCRLGGADRLPGLRGSRRRRFGRARSTDAARGFGHRRRGPRDRRRRPHLSRRASGDIRGARASPRRRDAWRSRWR